MDLGTTVRHLQGCTWHCCLLRLPKCSGPSPARLLATPVRRHLLEIRRRNDMLLQAAAASALEASEETASTAPGAEEEVSGAAAPPTSETWEMDFSSRPVLDDRGKKKWELLVCNPTGAWKYACYFPNNKINSTQVD